MTLIEFTRHFPNEDACKQHIKSLRERQGIVCNKCGGEKHYWKGFRNVWECKECGHRTSLTCGTMMHGTKLPLMYWFLSIHLLTSTKKAMSACELQCQLGHKRYQPIWEMLHKGTPCTSNYTKRGGKSFAMGSYRHQQCQKGDS